MDCGLCLGSKENRAFEFAKDLHDRWGVGDVKCQNGVVLFLSLRDHVMGLSVGRGVKHVLRTDMVPLIMGIMKPKLRKGEYGQAIVDGVHAIGNIVSGMEVQPVEENSSGSIFLPMFFGAGFLALIARNARRNQKFKRCKEALENIDKDRACAENNQFVVTSCPICLNDFKQSRDEDNEDTEEEEAQPLVEIDTNGPKSTNVGSSEHNVKSVSAGNGLRTANAGTGTMEQDVTSEGEDAVKILPCGHKFHERCILQWFSTPQQTNSQCPICRQSVLEPETVEARTNNGQPSGWDVYEPEYNFRMRRAQHYYSDFITLDMMNDWNSRRRDQTPMTTSPELTRLDPAAVTEARRSGADGSSFAFGGGSSAGGGGGGSSW
ncbi:unnamed protein product [Chondrus crispus]|uniref:RING-type domain-containing protein n=1 Tax=Chondrus crispus TaxID=2769 RepID=R7QDT1_CHOCR|nr:unnamed protein product [Chondrus crispus]CDF36672.1 unnamed protein product [Chondrus crispus]|eukprot:XP_005716491.1 unnamed protein product [Chondrus crispus]